MSAFSIEVSAENFREVVLEGSKQAPVVIDFWAPWCAPCRALKPILEKLAEEYAGRFTLAKINSDENQDIAASLGVRSIPAVKAVVDGKLVDEFIGALPESEVRAFINRVLPTPSDLARRQAAELLAAERAPEALSLLDSALQHDPRNERAKIDRIETLMRLGRNDEARTAIADLSPLSLDDSKLVALKARLEFADEVAEDAAELSRRVAGDPGDLAARLQLARQYVRAQNHEAALEQLMEIVRRDRKYGDDAGRRTMLEVFNLLGPQHELVGKYRRLLSAALY
jgi:putative thioredoxin